LSDGRKRKKAAVKKVPVQKKALMLGLGLDGTDGHTRITAGKNFKLVADRKTRTTPCRRLRSKSTRSWNRRQKRLEDLEGNEFAEIFWRGRKP